MTLPRVLVLTDRKQLPAGRTLTENVASCVRGGATHVVMRELDLSHEARAALAAKLAQIEDLVLITARSWFPGAVGMHLSASQSASPLAADVGDARFHGSSCHDEAEVGCAVAAGASYLTVSPVATSDSKPGYGPAIGESGVHKLVAFAKGMPVFALGGVDAGNARGFRDAGAHGVAVMGSLMRAEDPAATMEKLLAEVSR